MMKRLLSLSMFIVLIIAGAVAAEDARFSFVIPNPVVYDVPFLVQLLVDTNGVAFIDYDLSVGSSNGEAAFGNGVTRGDTFGYVGSLSGVQDGGVYYRVRTETNGYTLSPSEPMALLTFTNVRFVGMQDRSTQFILRESPQIITPASTAVTLSSRSESSSSITPQLSVCGDGVVGYVDGNTPGIKDGDDVNEACDDGNTLPGDGCAVDCSYVDLGYSCTNTNFGDRNSVCTPMPAGEFFVEKMNALLVDERCYPTNTHPDAIYNWFCDTNAGNDALTNSRVISSVLGALAQLLASLFP